MIEKCANASSSEVSEQSEEQSNMMLDLFEVTDVDKDVVSHGLDMRRNAIKSTEQEKEAHRLSIERIFNQRKFSIFSGSSKSSAGKMQSLSY